MNHRHRVPSTRSYRAAVKAIVSTVQRRHALNDVELADRLGCSASTIRNAKTEQTNLDAVTLANMEHRFGSGTLDPFLALAGSRATPLPTALPDIDPVLDIVTALHRLIEAQHAGSDHGYLLTSQELLAILHELRDARIAFDTLITLAEPGLAAAPPAVKQWFCQTFARAPEQHNSLNQEPDGSAGTIRKELPEDFEENALRYTTEQLATRYSASLEQVEIWLRASNERAISRLD